MLNPPWFERAGNGDTFRVANRTIASCALQSEAIAYPRAEYARTRSLFRVAARSSVSNR